PRRHGAGQVPGDGALARARQAGEPDRDAFVPRDHPRIDSTHGRQIPLVIGDDNDDGDGNRVFAAWRTNRVVPPRTLHVHGSGAPLFERPDGTGLELDGCSYTATWDYRNSYFHRPAGYFWPSGPRARPAARPRPPGRATAAARFLSGSGAACYH